MLGVKTMISRIFTHHVMNFFFNHKSGKQTTTIIKQRIDDNQLSECPLTLDELNKIKGTVDGNTGMLHVLRGIYHIRIEYPDD